MATTTFGSNPQTAKLWSKTVMKEALKNSIMGKFTGVSVYVDGKHTTRFGIIQWHHNGRPAKERKNPIFRYDDSPGSGRRYKGLALRW